MAHSYSHSRDPHSYSPHSSFTQHQSQSSPKGTSPDFVHQTTASVQEFRGDLSPGINTQTTLSQRQKSKERKQKEGPFQNMNRRLGFIRKIGITLYPILWGRLALHTSYSGLFVCPRVPLSCSQGMLMNHSICIFYFCFGRVLLSLPFFYKMEKPLFPQSHPQQ